MDLFITTFESVAVLLGIGVIGFLIIKRKIIPAELLSNLSPLALDIALPSLVFINIIQDFDPNLYPEWWQMPLWWCFFTVIAAGLTFVFMFFSKKENRKEFAISLFYQNGIFFPLAVLAGMYGSDSPYVSLLFLFTIFYAAFFFSTYQFFFKSEEKISINWRKIIHPVLIATVIAIFINQFGFKSYVPEVVISILVLLGGMTIPLLMLILGGNVYNDYKKTGEIELFEIMKFVLVKNFVFPILMIIILFFLKDILSYPVALILLLQAAVPPVTAVPLVVERAGGNRSIVNQFLVGSFVISLVSIPLMIYIFGLYFSV